MAKLLAPKRGGVYLAGIRDELRARYQRQAVDPRLLPDFTPDMSSDERRQANAASPVVRQAERTLARIDAGEDIEDGRPSAHDRPELAWRRLGTPTPRCAGSLCPQMTLCARFND